MREILFRGKRKDNGEWVEGFYGINTICCEQSTYLSAVISKMPQGIYDCESWEVEPNTVGQFTGLNDKSGTKIFEGDIVRYGDTIHEVVFEQRNGTAYFGLVYSEAETLPFGHYQDLRQIEVIGNIYDTPEHLKGAMKPAATDVAQSGLAPATENFSLQEA